MRAVSRGVLTLSDRDVRFEGWSVSTDDEVAQADPEVLPDWSYYQDLNITASVHLSHDAVFQALGLDRNARIGAVIAWSCPATSLRGASEVVAVRADTTAITTRIDGSLLRARVDLECQIMLLEPSEDPASVLTPYQVGTVLWSTRHSIALEGHGARLPIAPVSFADFGLPAGGGGHWWLQISAESLDVPAASAVWLWVNDESALVGELLERPTGDVAKTALALMKADIFRQLAAFALEHDDFELDAAYEEDSLGEMLSGPLRLLGDDLGSLRGEYQHDRSRFEARLQSVVGVI